MSKYQNEIFFNLLLTQKSITQKMPYDEIRKLIEKEILDLKERQLNAKIVNLALNIHGKLTLAQLYIERKNGFVPVNDTKYGSCPTCYNIQLRFPHGLNLKIKEEDVLLPSGEFIHPIAAYFSKFSAKVCDELYYEASPEEIRAGEGVMVKTEDTKVIRFSFQTGLSEELVSTTPLSQDPFKSSDTVFSGASVSISLKSNPSEKISFFALSDIGRGYTQREYDELIDYQVRLKVYGTYPLFSFSPFQPAVGLLRFHTEYSGSTSQVAQVKESDSFHEVRKTHYQKCLTHLEQEIQKNNPIVKKWLTNSQKHKKEEQYVFNVMMINNKIIFKETGFAITQLRNYQMELFYSYQSFIQNIEKNHRDHFGEGIPRHAQKSKRRNFSSKISMGVGGGKTFFTFTALQYLKKGIEEKHFTLAPPYCMAPNAAVAEVSKKAIDAQGLHSGILANVISQKEHMPDEFFLSVYQKITIQAQKESKSIIDTVQEGLQEQIIRFCQEKCLFPWIFVNAVYSCEHTGFYIKEKDETGKERMRQLSQEKLRPFFKETIDVNRLLLLIEGQKELMKKTQSSGIVALKALLQEFETIQKTLNLSDGKENPFGAHANLAIKKIDLSHFKLDYKQTFLFRKNLGRGGSYGASLESYGLATRFGKLSNGCYESKINFNTLTKEHLKEIITYRVTNWNTKLNTFVTNTRQVRDSLMRIAALNNKEAAILLANAGGLGSTDTEETLKKQIDLFAASASAELNRITQKDNLTLFEHYTLYLYFNEIFLDIPEEIHFKKVLRKHRIDPDRNYVLPNTDDTGQKKYTPVVTPLDEVNFSRELYVCLLQSIIELINNIVVSIKKQLNAMTLAHSIVSNSSEEASLFNRFGLEKNITTIEAAFQLAGIAGLNIVGKPQKEDEHLLLSHIAVFTPEGLACYFEHLASLENKPYYSFQESAQVYFSIQSTKKISRANIQDRIISFLNTLMIADEVHKEEFSFLYDFKNSYYQRINKVVFRFLGVHFIDYLPNRIGMSGTINRISERAFSEGILYNLSTQKMIQVGYVKQVNSESSSFHFQPEQHDTAAQKEKILKEYVIQIVINYFTQNIHFSLERYAATGEPGIDLFFVSKGLLFVKNHQKNPALLEQLKYYFNLLVKQVVKETEKKEQEILFEAINQARQLRHAYFLKKISGQDSLSREEQEAVNRFSYQNDFQLTLAEGKFNAQSVQFIQVHYKTQPVSFLTPKILHERQKSLLVNNLFSIYLEFVLSKSTLPKELSDIIGLQNQLFEKGITLTRFYTASHDLAQEMVSAIAQVDDKTINHDEKTTQFFGARIQIVSIRDSLQQMVVQHKKNYLKVVEALSDFCDHQEVMILTSDRGAFEAGLSMVLLGTTNEATGYSHEPIGIIADIPDSYKVMGEINHTLFVYQYGASDGTRQPPIAMAESFYQGLVAQCQATFSYDEKNQAGGRALRTPFGQVRYLEFNTKLKEFISEHAQTMPCLYALEIETTFVDIFNSDEAYTAKQRASIQFNRAALMRLAQEDFSNFDDYRKAVSVHFKGELCDQRTKKEYQTFLSERLPLLFALKYAPKLAQDFLCAPTAPNFMHLNNAFVSVLNQKSFVPENIGAVSEKSEEEEVISDQAEQPVAELLLEEENSDESSQQERVVSTELIASLERYVNRIEGYHGHYGQDFCFFPASRAINREANYYLAKWLLDTIKNTDSDIAHLFSDASLKEQRLKLINQHQLNLRPDYVARGINSTELNEVIFQAQEHFSLKK